MGDDEDNDDFWDEEVIDEREFEAEGWEEISKDPEQASKVFEALGGLVPDILRRAVEKGMGGLSTSEERIRSLLDQERLPAEVVEFLVAQADATKKGLYRAVSKEVRDFLENADLGGELAKILTRLSLEANVRVRFVENEEMEGDVVRPKASGKMRVSDSGSGEEPHEEAEEERAFDDEGEDGDGGDGAEEGDEEE